MAPKSRSRWQKVGEFLIWVAFIGVFGGIIASRFGLLSWTGIYRWTGFSTKTGWDWLQLLIIPIILAIGGFWLNQVQKRREERITQEQKEAEQEVATDNQRESLLHTYIDKMSELLVEKQLRDTEEDDERREIARIRTLTVLSRLDGSRKRIVLQFLHEAGLIDKDKHVIDLHGANLRKAKLSEAKLNGADLRGVDLSKANLRGVDLSKANLRGVDFDGADLGGARLSEANLFGADLRGAYLGNVDLSGATLDRATLREDDLHHATFNGATLRACFVNGRRASRVIN